MYVNFSTNLNGGEVWLLPPGKERLKISIILFAGPTIAGGEKRFVRDAGFHEDLELQAVRIIQLPIDGVEVSGIEGTAVPGLAGTVHVDDSLPCPRLHRNEETHGHERELDQRRHDVAPATWFIHNQPTIFFSKSQDDLTLMTPATPPTPSW